MSFTPTRLTSAKQNYTLTQTETPEGVELRSPVFPSKVWKGADLSGAMTAFNKEIASLTPEPQPPAWVTSLDRSRGRA